MINGINLNTRNEDILLIYTVMKLQSSRNLKVQSVHKMVYFFRSVFLRLEPEQLNNFI